MLAHSSKHYTAVLILVHWLKLLLPAALTCSGVIAVELILAHNICAFDPSPSCKELCLLIIAAGHNTERTHKDLQGPALSIPWHLLVRKDKCTCTFVPVSAAELIAHFYRGY